MVKPLNHLSREELYVLVWQTPMSRFAPEYGISGNGLAQPFRILASAGGAS